MAEEIRDISLASKKKSFRIDGDNNRIIYLDTTDMNIIVRLEETYQDLYKLALEATDRLVESKNNPQGDDESPLTDYAKILKDIDKQMREKLDYIFDSPISDVCVPTGNMYSMHNGEWEFEHILDALSGLYAGDFTKEVKKMSERVKKHTAKYTGKRNRK